MAKSQYYLYMQLQSKLFNPKYIYSFMHVHTALEVSQIFTLIAKHLFDIFRPSDFKMLWTDLI